MAAFSPDDPGSDLHHGLAERDEKDLQGLSLLLQLANCDAEDDAEHDQAEYVRSLGPFRSNFPRGRLGYKADEKREVNDLIWTRLLQLIDLLRSPVSLAGRFRMVRYCFGKRRERKAMRNNEITAHGRWKFNWPTTYLGDGGLHEIRREQVTGGGGN